MRTKRFILLLAVPALLVGTALSSPQTSWETTLEQRTNERQPPDKVLPAIGVKPGMIIGEVGAGRGRYTVHLARGVGDTGKIYAEDINAGSLDYLRRRCQEEGIRNVEAILGRVDDPLFPRSSLDMVFMVLTYHHLAKPVELLENLVPCLKPGATIVIIDPDPEKDEDRGGHESTSVEKMSREASRAGLHVARVETFLERDNIFILTSPAEHDLTKAAVGQGWKVVNRSATVIEDGGRTGIRLDERPGDGLVWLEGARFGDGTIEFDVRGKDDFQKSFVGAAFHGADDRTFEAVYFRPFNFRPADPARAVRAVQYVSHPEFTWQKLRAEKPGQYERAVAPVPDPNGWFHVRIVVARPRISVFVDGAAEPCLTVDALGDRADGLVGLMVGNGSGGDFSGFRITPASAGK